MEGAYHVYGREDLILQRCHFPPSYSNQNNLNQNPNLFSENWHTNSKMSRKMQNAKNNSGNLEEQKEYSGGLATSAIKTF